MHTPCYKNIRATKRCEISLINWSKSHQDEEKGNNLISKMHDLKIYEISMFATIPYDSSLEISRFLQRQVVSKS